MRGLLAIALTTLLLTACARNTDDQTTNTLAPPSTTETTTIPTTTTKEPTLEDNLLAFHSEQMNLVVDTSQPDGWEQFKTWYEANSVDPARTRIVDGFTRLIEQGQVIKTPGSLSNVVGLDWHSASGPEQVAERGVTVSDCTLGRAQAYNADGSVSSERAGSFKVIDYVYSYDLTGDRFRIAEVVTADGTSCDPVDLIEDYGGVSSLSDADDVLATHAEFIAALGEIDQRSNGYGPTYEAIDKLTTSTAHELLVAYVKEHEANGWLTDGGGYDSNIVGMRVDGRRATVVDCSRILFSIYDIEGNALTGPDDFYELRETFLVKEEGRWRVEYYWQNGDQECDPSRF